MSRFENFLFMLQSEFKGEMQRFWVFDFIVLLDKDT